MATKEQIINAYVSYEKSKGGKPSNSGLERWLQSQSRGPRRVTQDNEEERKKQMYIWAAKQGVNIAQATPAVRQKMSEYFAKYVYDSSKTSAEMQAGGAAGLAGLESLANAFASKGELTEADYKRAGIKGGMAGVQNYMSRIPKGIVGGAGYSSLMAGAGSVLGDVAAGQDVNWGKAGKGAAIAGGKTLATRGLGYAVAQNTGSAAAGQAAASTFGGVLGAGMIAAQHGASKKAGREGTYAQYRQSKSGAAKMGAGLGVFGAMATAAAGGWGGAVGQAIGSVVGGLRDKGKATDRYAYSYAGGDPVRYNPKTGKFEASKVLGVRRYHEQMGIAQPIAFDEKEPPQYWLQGEQQRMIDYANSLNEKVANMDNLPVDQQLQLQKAMETGGVMTKSLRDAAGNVVDRRVIYDPSVGTSAGRMAVGMREQARGNKPANWDMMNWEQQKAWMKEDRKNRTLASMTAEEYLSNQPYTPPTGESLMGRLEQGESYRDPRLAEWDKLQEQYNAEPVDQVSSTISAVQERKSQGLFLTAQQQQVLQNAQQRETYLSSKPEEADYSLMTGDQQADYIRRSMDYERGQTADEYDRQQATLLYGAEDASRMFDTETPT